MNTTTQTPGLNVKFPSPPEGVPDYLQFPLAPQGVLGVPDYLQFPSPPQGVPGVSAEPHVGIAGKFPRARVAQLTSPSEQNKKVSIEVYGNTPGEKMAEHLAERLRKMHLEDIQPSRGSQPPNKYVFPSNINNIENPFERIQAKLTYLRTLKGGKSRYNRKRKQRKTRRNNKRTL